MNPATENKFLLVASRVLAYLFHPLLLVVYGTVLVFTTHPIRYAQYNEKQLSLTLILIFALTVVFPVFSLSIMKLIGFIENFKMPDKKERTIPYIAICTFYFWTFFTMRNGEFPSDPVLMGMVMGATVAAFVAFFFNIFLKISLHSLGGGAMIAMAILAAPTATINMQPLLFVIVPIAGAIGTSRLLLGAHTQREVYLGYVVGFIGMFIGFKLIAPLLLL